MSNIASDNFARGLNGSAKLPKQTFSQQLKADLGRVPAGVGNGSVLAASGLMSLALPSLEKAFPQMGKNAKSILASMPATQPKFANALANVAGGIAGKAISILTAGAVKLPHRG